MPIWNEPPSKTLFRFMRRATVCMVAALLTTGAFAQKPLETVGAIRALSPEQAKAEKPVVLHGVVTTLSGWKNSFFFADATAGISIDRTTDLPATHQGDEVEVHGHTNAGLFAPLVIADSVRVLGAGKLPATKTYTAAELSGGDKDSQWIAVRGIVRSAEVKTVWGSPRLVLSVDTGAGTLISAMVQQFDPKTAASLTAATVLLKGVCGTIFNDRRQFVGVRLFVAGPNDITVERPAPEEPFDMPERQLNALLRFSDNKYQTPQVKVSGVVTWARAGQGIYLQEGAQGVFVQSGLAQTVPIGAKVEAVGYPALGLYSPQLENAIFRVRDKAEPIKPIDVQANQMIVAKDGFATGPYDSLLVRLQGTLLESIPSGDDRVLLLQDGSTVFTARIALGTLKGMLRLDNGSRIQVTGICSISANPQHEPRSFTVLMRSRTDVTVLHGAPWWTAKHAQWLVGALALITLVMFVIVTFLRRQARLRELVVADPLTGLYNRRGFLAFAQDRWQSAQKQGATVMLFYIDLDKFKEINDTFGHKMGDLALQRVASLLRESFRKADVVGRLGGDEFAVVALDAGETRAVLENRLLSAVKQTNEKQRFAFEIQLSIGVVVSEASTSKATIEDLLSEADTVMYEQKRRRKAAR